MLVPFTYTFETRLKSRRDFAYNVVMAWLPAIALLVLAGEEEPWTALTTFTIGYLAFISIYELGYLGNDVWDAHRDPNGRQRINFKVTARWITVFVFVRLVCFLGIAIGTGWWTNVQWSGGFAVLAIAFTLHNLVSNIVRLLTFPILTILRFLLPILGVLKPQEAWVALIVATLPYLMPRWLAYAESKSIVSNKMRQIPAFRSLFLCALAPIVTAACYGLKSWVPLVIHGYYLVVTLVGERMVLKQRPLAS